MKKLAVIFATILVLTSFAGCIAAPTPVTQPATQPPTEPPKLFITSDEVDLRQMVVDYMLQMANIQWTAGVTIDYSNNSKTLVYEAGKTYLGIVYNNNRNGLEGFRAILDENNLYTGTDTNWNTSPGNSCATCIEHAWQLISPSVEYEYSIDMMPVYENTGVIGLGDIDWSCYDGKNTNSIIRGNERKVVLEAYALAKPGDALVRYQNTGGHALMVTKESTIVRNPDGSINMAQSFMYLTDQNNRLNNSREYPSSWAVDKKTSFANILQDGFLPVSVAELLNGAAPITTITVTPPPTAEALAYGNVTGPVDSKYCLNTVRVEIRSGDQVVASTQKHPYKRSFDLATLSKALNISQLPAGQYTLVLVAEVGLVTETLLSTSFSK